MIIDPATLTPSMRALGTFAVIAAGTAAAVTGGPLVVAGVAGVTGLLTNFLASDIEQAWADRANDPKYSHPNNDLIRLVGDAIALVLYDTAKEPAEKAQRKQFDQLAKIASETYLNLAEHRDFQELTSQNLPELFRQAVERPDDQLPLLNMPTWIQFVEHLRNKIHLPANCANTEKAAERLLRKLFPAIREMVKRNFSGNGRAYAALSVDMSATLMKYVVQIQESQNTNQEQLQIVIAQMDTIQIAQRTALTKEQSRDLSWLIDEFATYRQVWRDTHRHAKVAADNSVLLREELKEYQANIFALLANKTAGEDPTQKQLPPELVEQAKLLLERGNQEQQALAEIALKNHAGADKLIQELKRNPLAEAFRLLTLEGTNWYQAGEFDLAIEPYEQALALQPRNLSARNNAALSQQSARLGNIAAHVERSIEIQSATLKLLTKEVHPENWALTQNNLGNAWGNLPTGDRGANLVRAIECYEAALTVRTLESHPVDWAGTQNNLGAAWGDMPTGDRGDNLGRAIASYEAALTVYTREAHPVTWAGTQNNLGNAWGGMPTGDWGQNVGRAIASYEAALTVYTREVHPVTWAGAQNNLGIAWGKLPTGERGANLGRAIDCYEAALTVYTRDAHPVTWAMMQNNLGNVWGDLPTGDCGVNLLRSIECHEAALTVYTRDAHPCEWAWTQKNLGNVRGNLPTGDRGANLVQAIKCYEAALTVFTREAHPVDWAGTQNHLGNAWGDLPARDREANLAQAIKCYEAALTVFTRVAHPVDWARTQICLGNTWAVLPKGDLGANLNRSIKAMEAALTVLTRDAHPVDWALTKNNLGNAWVILTTGDRGANLVQAIECFKAALTIRTRDAHPVDWAATQNNLGNAWLNLRTGDRAANLDMAIECYEAALTIRTRVADPFDWAGTQSNLGIVFTTMAKIFPEKKCTLLSRAISCSKGALLVRTRNQFPREHQESLKRLNNDRAVYDATKCSIEVPFDDIPPAT